MLSYRVMLDVPFRLAAFVPGLLAEHRREPGTRDGTRALTCWTQAVVARAWFRDRPDIGRLGAGSGLPYLILDGTLISAGRCAGTKTGKKGRRSIPGIAARPMSQPGTCRHWPRPAACRCGSRTCCRAAPLT